MLFIVGGAARSGKTLLARRMLSEDHVAWFSLDTLRAGLTRGAPSLGLDFDRDDLEEGDRLWPIIKEMITSLLLDGIPYLLESSCLRPSSVANLIDKVGNRSIRAVFLGYPELNVHEKLSQIAENGIGGNDWFSSLSNPDKLKHVSRMIKDSRTVRDECNAFGVRFFDTGRDFEKAQMQALKYLREDAW